METIKNINDFYINMIINDITVVDIYKTNKIATTKIKVKCNICNRERIVGIRNIIYRTAKTTFHKYCSFQLPPFEKQFFSSWSNMRTRTTNDNVEKSKNYKKRGIKSDEFKYFIDFYDKMYSSYAKHIAIYGTENTTIERIDVNKDYSFENCTWTTWEKQAKNKTNLLVFKAISPDGNVYFEKNLKEFCEKQGINYNNIIGNLTRRKKTKTRSGWQFIIFQECKD